MSKMDFAGFSPAEAVTTAAAVTSPRRNGALSIVLAPRFSVDGALARFVGSVLVIASGAMWMLPDAQADADLVVMKLGASLFFLLVGVALMAYDDLLRRPEACFDPLRRELRVLRMAADGRVETTLRRGYDSFGRVEWRGHRVRIYEMDGTLLLGLTVREAAQRAQLSDQLAQHVNLCA
ncbi:hypothetical protein [Pseudodonghicola flavimaris]|uniref:DUF2244 domain-containing protein n=1 Tax=Pseudodonghicola flavimaris TaxID=3050036 RepID=A0ABT7F3S6_9RHOB|nr:hypothetical protein [Pseudodonghicola flavimaris]MDK3019267.1 hypothetical protein [Pseudodonghicola flavimaris]